MPPSERTPADRLRYVPLAGDGGVALSFGFDGRIDYEYFEDARFGDEPGPDGSTHMRANLHAGLSFGDRARLYGAIKFGDVAGRRFPVAPVDDDGPDLHQAFAELSFGDAFGLPVQDAFVRVGRQELHYGSGRLISVRGGPNVRSDYDGLLVRVAAGDVIADAFAVRPTEVEPGPWNNGTDQSQSLWGFYAAVPLTRLWTDAPGVLDRANLDLFYVGLDREESAYAFQAAPLDETRHTVGARLWTGGPPTEGWGLEIEGGVQFGKARGLAGRTGDIRAGYLAGNVSYGFADVPWTPVLDLRFGLSSGDGDPGDGTLGTFRAPFPPGRYFGDASPLGPGNLFGLGPGLTVRPTDTLTLGTRYEAFWRLREGDGIYSPAQVPLRPPGGGGRFVGQEIGLDLDYAVGATTTFSLSAARFFPGGALDAAPPAKPVTFLGAEIAVRF